MSSRLILMLFVLLCVGCSPSVKEIPVFQINDVIQDVETNRYGIVTCLNHHQNNWTYNVTTKDNKLIYWVPQDKLRLHKRCIWGENGPDWINPEAILIPPAPKFLPDEMRLFNQDTKKWVEPPLYRDYSA